MVDSKAVVKENLISDENVTVKSGDHKKIRVKEVQIPRDTLVIPCAITHHVLGYISSVRCKDSPKLVTEERCVESVIFSARNDGEISREEQIGEINIFPSMSSRATTKLVKPST